MILDSITTLQNSVKQLWEPVRIVMSVNVYNELNREAEKCSLVQISGSQHISRLSSVNGLDIIVSKSIGENEVMFVGAGGNFSSFVLAKNIGKPKRKGRFIRCDCTTT